MWCRLHFLVGFKSFLGSWGSARSQIAVWIWASEIAVRLQHYSVLSWNRETMKHTAVILQSSVSTGHTLCWNWLWPGTGNHQGFIFSYHLPQNIFLFYWQIIVESAKQILQNKWELGRKLKKANLKFEDLSLKASTTYTPIYKRIWRVCLLFCI